MKLLVIILCLLSERYLIHSLSYKRFYWFDSYYNKLKTISNTPSIQNPWLKLALLLLPIVFIVFIVYFLINGIFFGLIGFILNVLILFYCIGPQNPFYPTADSSLRQDAGIGQYLADVNRQLFAPVFWYLVGGPIAVLTYRLITLAISIPSTSKEAQVLTDILEWIPARMTVLLYLLVGNFQRGFQQYMHFFLSKPALNITMLSTCGLLAAQTDESSELPMITAENLVVQTCIVLLVFIALIVLVAGLR